MPELPPKERQRPRSLLCGHAPAAPESAAPRAAAPGDARRYAELRSKTNFSFLVGASHPDELVARAAGLGYAALAITDLNSLAGVVRAHVAAKTAGLKLVIGAEITPADAPPILLYAPDAAAYGRLARLITLGRRAADKGDCYLELRDVAMHAEGLLAAVAFPPRSRAPAPAHPPPLREAVAARAPLPGYPLWDRPRRAPESDDDFCSLATYGEIFRDRCHLAAARHLGPDDDRELERLARLARRARVPMVASNDVHFHVPDRRPLCDVLAAIRHGRTVAELGALRFPNGERYLKTPAQMHALFAACPRAIAQGVELAGRCTFSLDALRYEYPEELCPPGTTPARHLAELTWAGAHGRYPGGVPQKVAALVERELRLIEELHYEAYFLTVWDLVRFARARGILCQGRGSAANSAVCYCLGITSVDPDRSDVLFERFISRERNEAPDIDVDFEHERREEVLQHVYAKYGRDRAGLVAEVISYRARSAVRDAGKALGLSLDRVDRLAKTLEQYGDEPNLAARAREAGLDPNAPGVTRLIRIADELIGFPRHLSQHVGGFVITRGRLSELVPIENAAMPDRTVIQWDKDDLDALGILKVDCLALGMLTAVRKCFDLVARHHGRPLTLATVPAEDPAVYDMICRADTVGVFQIESRAQMSMLPRLLPRCFYDLVIEVAIVRPGPIQGGMVHPYLRRRRGEEPVTYPNAIVERVLHKTLGVPLFQEQVMRLAVEAAGFTAGEADELRRAMGAWRRPGLIEQFRTKLRAGLVARGLDADFAEQLYEQIRGFGEYGFPEAHAASFALVAYVSAWLKRHYPASFTVALLNSQPMGFYAPAQLVRDAQSHGVVVRPIDINHSHWDATLEKNAEAPALDSGLSTLDSFREPALRLGLRLIQGLPQAAAVAIEQARNDRPFRSVPDVARRTGLSRPVLARLAAADAFGTLGLSRRAALWQVLSVEPELPLFAGIDEDEPAPRLAAMPIGTQVVADYASIGLSLRAHPIGLVRPELERLGTLPASEVMRTPDGAIVRVAGLVLVRQHPATAKGTIFITLEDETGVVNLVVWPAVWQRYRPVARNAVALFARGKLQRSQDVALICVNQFEDMSSLLRGLSSHSRDFR